MRTLEEFGLTKYESKAYLTLLTIGISDARKLSSKSNLPFGRIYDVLSSLESKGLVETQASRPKRFLAVEPRLALKKLLDMKNEEIDFLKERAGKIEEELNSISIKIPKKSLFWSVALGDEIMKAYLEKILETKKELFAYVELPQISVHNKKKEINEFLKVISKLIEKGVKVKLLIGCKKTKALDRILHLITPFLGLLKDLEVRIASTISNPFDVIDGEKVQIKVRNPANPDEFFASIYIWQKEFAEELRKKFNKIWKEAKEFKIELK